MITKIINVLCEGPTEDRFVAEVLKPHLMNLGIVTKHRLLMTSRKKNAYGGMISYSQAKGDLTKWMKEVYQEKNVEHYFTTMFDFYALPNGFPEFCDTKNISDAYSKVNKIEESLAADIGWKNFIPYIQLHEFEALLFCDIRKLEKQYPRCKKDIQGLNDVLQSYNGNPEMINSGVDTAPSKRIISAIEGKRFYRYNKPSSGANVTAEIGIDNLKSKCRHFKMWLEKLEGLKDNDS